MNVDRNYVKASIKTADNLKIIARSMMVSNLSRLSLPEIDAVVDVVARMVPAGNVPGVILNGLARLAGRKPPPQIIARDVNLLFKGVEQTLDKAVYAAFFAGPAAIIWGYQNLLKLAGKDPEDSFPKGVWQFYVDYALREDTARHANETHGFDTALNQHQIQLSAVDRATAWAMAAIQCLHQYDALLENEWRERMYLCLLSQVTRDEPDVVHYARLSRNWAKQRPYQRGSDAGSDEAYPAYRRRLFDCFLEEATRNLPDDLHREWVKRIHVAEAEDLAAYQRQMSILAYLEPGSYNETHTPIPLEKARIGVVYQDRYTLLPACTPGATRPAEVATVRQAIAALMGMPPQTPPARLDRLTALRRAALPKLRAQMSTALVRDLDTLRCAPILLNCDRRPRHLPLAELRQAERGVGDHALTCFDTGETFVFDQSHIFFDGAWGAALAEIMTNEALSWAIYLNALPPAQPGPARPTWLAFPFQEADLERIQQAPRVTLEACAETDVVNIKAILTLRKLMKRRNDLIQLTVNDLLILYRAIHAVTYQPDPTLVAELQRLTHDAATRKAASTALAALDKQENPAVLIPVDASQRSPRDRLYPMTFEVPLADLDLLNLHRRVVAALDAYDQAVGDRSTPYAEFDRLQRVYLAALAGFGQVLSRAKEIANAGESGSVGTIKLLAHMPAPLQRMLDQVPARFDVLNDIIKGREVFSNVGAVAPNSTLTRFITAKDDNEKKTLAWGVITDARGVMRISLRDFRPHVAVLAACGCHDLATRIAQDYLSTYAHGLNDFIRDLQRITRASRETRLLKLGDMDERSFD
jgi:hypothetical protein